MMSGRAVEGSKNCRTATGVARKLQGFEFRGGLEEPRGQRELRPVIWDFWSNRYSNEFGTRLSRAHSFLHPSVGPLAVELELDTISTSA
jgi:hypothetical protein